MRKFYSCRMQARKNYTVTASNIGGVNIREYPELQLPTRATPQSSGYDFYSPITVGIEIGQTVVIWTDIKANMLPDEYLAIHMRSSLAIKHGLMLTNCTGIIDADYFNNSDNDGNIGIAITNYGEDTYIIEEGDRIAQGIFMKYLVTIDDTVESTQREGGTGSTGK